MDTAVVNDILHRIHQLAEADPKWLIERLVHEGNSQPLDQTMLAVIDASFKDTLGMAEPARFGRRVLEIANNLGIAEVVLGEYWTRAEEDEAWRDLQQYE